ncbi:MAG: hypothetical protein PHE27_01115, partial [Alphaproteobacteria bacterium]|nr:hypothetical protein [Alphaproteobacteria bacterium]
MEDFSNGQYRTGDWIRFNPNAVCAGNDVAGCIVAVAPLDPQSDRLAKRLMEEYPDLRGGEPVYRVHLDVPVYPGDSDYREDKGEQKQVRSILYPVTRF